MKSLQYCLMLAIFFLHSCNEGSRAKFEKANLYEIISGDWDSEDRIQIGFLFELDSTGIMLKSTPHIGPRVLSSDSEMYYTRGSFNYTVTEFPNVFDMVGELRGIAKEAEMLQYDYDIPPYRECIIKIDYDDYTQIEDIEYLCLVTKEKMWLKEYINGVTGSHEIELIKNSE